MKKKYTKEEMLKAIDEAFWDGVDQGRGDYAGENFIPQDYLPKDEED